MIGRMFRVCVALLVAGAGLSASARADEVVSPAEHLGRPVGTDFRLADWDEVRGYYGKLAAASPRVRLEVAGKTTEGRDLLYAVISSEANLARLDEIKAHAATIADPRGKTAEQKAAAVRDGRVILFITPTMHATETAATEMGMELSWLLATSDAEPWRSAREHVVTVIVPTLNPDGLDHVVSWYRQHVGGPYEAADLPKLYQFYTGHDNNRDWFMLTQAETRHLTRLMYRDWHPQVLWDVHQQGNQKERFFVPPFRDPLDANIDPAIVAGLNLLGTRAVLDMTRDGLTGVATGVSYDNWYLGGNRSVPSRHNVLGILTEAASVNIASPVFQPRGSLKDPLGGPEYGPSNQFVKPWPGGWWRLRNIVEVELGFGRSLLGSLSRERAFWLSNALETAERAVAPGPADGPRGWLLPPGSGDRDAARRLIDALLASGVEVRTALTPFTADGRDYPNGTVVIRRDQPYGRYVKDLFETQTFPSGQKPYDVSGWTLPLLLGVRRVAVMNNIAADARPISDATEAVAAFPGDPRAGAGELSASQSGDWTALARRLGAGESFAFITEGKSAGLFRPIASKAVEAPRPGGTPAPVGPSLPYGSSPGVQTLNRLPRIAVYSPWIGSMDEGWLRWVFDEFRLPFTTVRNETLRAGALREAFDVLILPDISASTLNDGRTVGSIPDAIAGGLGAEGALAVDAFVRDGGRLVAIGRAAPWAIDLLRLPLVDVTDEKSAAGFSCPGSVLRGVPTDSGWTAGLPDDLALFFSKNLGWRAMTADERESARLDDIRVTPLLRYAPTRLLLSGYLAEPQVLEGRDAWVTARIGHGRVHLFGFSPHYRGWSQATFPLLFRAIFLDQ